MKVMKEGAMEREVDKALTSLHLPAIKSIWKEMSRKAVKESALPAVYLLDSVEL